MSHPPLSYDTFRGFIQSIAHHWQRTARDGGGVLSEQEASAWRDDMLHVGVTQSIWNRALEEDQLLVMRALTQVVQSTNAGREDTSDIYVASFVSATQSDRAWAARTPTRY